MAASKLYLGTGRRKTSIARVIVLKGKGKITINDRTLEEYFPFALHQMTVKQPLVILAAEGKFDIKINVQGGGIHSQAQAIRHGLSRAFIEVDETNRPSLKANGFLTRDPRMVERKKYGQPSARAKFQFSKR
ncbi:MAG: 30S ribosomal protein S9 [Spirochaetes bacterium GWB1_48_6]|nr:MAG: 30S ribosomal protein S9 [Spirochaetes bacterium GWB1_48_6]